MVCLPALPNANRSARVSAPGWAVMAAYAASCSIADRRNPSALVSRLHLASQLVIVRGRGEERVPLARIERERAIAQFLHPSPALSGTAHGKPNTRSAAVSPWSVWAHCRSRGLSGQFSTMFTYQAGVLAFHRAGGLVATRWRERAWFGWAWSSRSDVRPALGEPLPSVR